MDISNTLPPNLIQQEKNVDIQMQEIAKTVKSTQNIRQQTLGNTEINTSGMNRTTNQGNVNAALIADDSVRTLLYTQENAFKKTDKDTDTTTKSSAVEEFLEFMSKTPEERWREQILKSMGLTEEQLAALPPEEREEVEEKIIKIIEDKIENAIANKQRESVIKGQISSMQNQREMQSILKNTDDPIKAALDIAQAQNDKNEDLT
ncbi:MAG: hypothetical protein COA45_00365 [Zetaproteobacteria bacterium]|nr:MAG: hypothetical protein COA45_00365 [Zetaproteobacteria bacterium]